MELNGFTGMLYRISEWIMRLVYLNILWIAFSLLGFIFLGFFPATAAMFAVVRKWVMGETDIAIFREFWRSYRTEFWKVNGLGFLLLIGWYILYFDIEFFPSGNQFIHLILRAGLVGTILMFSIFCMFFFPVYAHFELKIYQHLKKTFFMCLISPVSTTLMIVASAGLFFLMMKAPGLIPFFSGSASSFAWMWIAIKSF